MSACLTVPIFVVSIDVTGAADLFFFNLVKNVISKGLWRIYPFENLHPCGSNASLSHGVLKGTGPHQPLEGLRGGVSQHFVSSAFDHRCEVIEHH